MKFLPTRSESRWIRILSGLTVIILAVFFIRPMLPASYPRHEPLADRESLMHLLTGKLLPQPPVETSAHFHDKDVTVPGMNELGIFMTLRSVLGVTNTEKRIEVDLTSQKVYAYDGEHKVFEFTVSTGKWAPTPVGEFRIWAKVRSQKMSGGEKRLGTYYYLPNVPYVMFFYNNAIAKMRGFSFHGTYWHDNFGHPMSHGCVNMRIADAKTLYEWAGPVVTNEKAWSTLSDASNMGTRVIIYGETPNE